MGNQCSASLAPGLSDDILRFGCGRMALRNHHCEEECDPCHDEDLPETNSYLNTTAHPLLQEQRGGSRPRTPRGPTPPWAVPVKGTLVDRTATGPTPPRSPTPPRCTPPGLPDEEAKGDISLQTLMVSLGQSFAKDLFISVRQGNTTAVSDLIRRAKSAAASLSGSGPERDARASDLVGAYLTKVREPSSTKKESLLGVAALGGHIPSLMLLFSENTDPLAADDRGYTALHKAAEGNHLLAVLVVLDRMQAAERNLQLSELLNENGEDPGAFAASLGAGEICNALEVFTDLQRNAEIRQVGCTRSTRELFGTMSTVNMTGEVISTIDLAPGENSASTTALLRRSSVGTRLVPNLFQRIPEDKEALRQFVERVCSGLCTAERLLKESTWNATDPGVDQAIRSFIITADLRSRWQKIRDEAIKTHAREVPKEKLDDFWQTHITAEGMAWTIRECLGDTFKLLLSTLWLYTREAWFRHMLDALASALHQLSEVEVARSTRPPVEEGATGATPHASNLPLAFQDLAPFLDALAPSMQLVQGALLWFEEANIRHSGITWRPLFLPMLGLQRMVDKYTGLPKQSEIPKEQSGKLDTGVWLSLGSGSFFSSQSSRTNAIRRLLRSRCNAMLIIRPDDTHPSYPKQMSLRGNSVDDSLYPLETLFRIDRITKGSSADFDLNYGGKGKNGRWPVITIEVSSSNRYMEIMETLHRRNDLGKGELVTKLQEWTGASASSQMPDRLLEAGLLLSSLAKPPEVQGVAQSEAAAAAQFASKATQFFDQAAQKAEVLGALALAAEALLAKARLGTSTTKDADVNKAVKLLEQAFGDGSPEVTRAKADARQLGVLLKAS